MGLTLPLEPVVTVNSTYTASAKDVNILANGTFSVFLHPAAGLRGRTYVIRNIGSGTVTVDANGAELVDDAATKAVTAGLAVTIKSDGTQWWTTTSGGGGVGGGDADTLDGQHGAYYTNATNITTGTLPAAQLSGTYGNASVNAAVSANTANNATYAYGKTEGNLNVNSAVSANNATYAFGKSESGLNVNSASTANNSTYAYGKTEGQLNVNNAVTSNTANNSTYAYGKSEGNLNVNSAVNANTANNATYAYGKSESALNVNSAVGANNATYAYGKTEGNLNVNSAVNANTANNATYAYGKTEGNLNVNSAVNANTANNATYAYGKTEGNLNVNSAVNANNSTYAYGKTEGNLNVNSAVNANQVTGATVNTNSSAVLVGANVYANTSAFKVGNSSVNAVLTQSQLTINGATLNSSFFTGRSNTALTANNSTYAFGKSEGALNVNSALSANNSTYAYGKTEGNLNVNSAVNANTANNATYAYGKTEGNLNVNSALGANNSTYAYGKTEGNLNVNSAVGANNATYAYGKTEGNLNVNSAVGANQVTGATVNTNASAVLIGANVYVNTSAVFIGNSSVNVALSQNALKINGSAGSNAQILMSNGSTILWATAPGASYTYQWLDTLTAQFTGAQTVFTLQSGGSNVAPASAYQVFVSLGGVWQEAINAYTISGNTITFSEAPNTGTSMFGIVLGASIDTGVPTAGVDYNPRNLIASGNVVVGNSSSNIVITNSAILINGSVGTNGQVLTSNGSVVSWQAGASQNATFLTTNTVTTNSTGLYVGANIFVNTSALSIGGNTVNSTVWTGQAYTANNSTNLNGKSEGNLNVNNATYVNGAVLTNSTGFFFGSNVTINTSVLWANVVIKASGSAGRVVLPVGTNLYAT